MNTYKLKISYCGTAYQGWQIQPKRHLTIQGQLVMALEKITKSSADQLVVIGSGRTDSGVHALSQVVKVSLPFNLKEEALLRALNSHLPEDIRVFDCEVCPEDFHPVFHALWKTYEYYFLISDFLSPFALNRVTHRRDHLDTKAIELALKEFEGSHDFINFSTKGTEVKSTIRTIHEAKLEEVEGFFPYQGVGEGRLYKASLTGNGFLKQMVRLVMGAAFQCGKGKARSEDISSFFQADTVQKMGPVAPPEGLYLKHVEYEKSWSPRD